MAYGKKKKKKLKFQKVMQHFHISGFCRWREREEEKKGIIIQVVSCFFCAPAKDKLLLLKAAETFRALRRNAGGRGPGSLPSRRRERGE